MGSLNSLPLCSRARVEGVDGNNNLPGHLNREVGVVEVQPEATSTPKLSLRRIEPLPERDLGESSNSDSLESDLELRGEDVSDRTFGSDSGLDNSGDEMEATREVEVAEDDSLDHEVNEAVSEEEETSESLVTGDLGTDRATTFRTSHPDPPVDLDELPDLSAQYSELEEEVEIAKQEEKQTEEETKEEDNEHDIEARMARKVEALGGDTEAAITSMLTDLVVVGDSVER